MPIFRYNEQPGNYYAYLIESSGDDANDGLTPETAVESLDRLVEILDTYAGADRRHAVIVKKRIYNEGITYARTLSKPITFEFVGGCEIDGSGAAFLQVNITGDIVYNATVVNYTKHFSIGGAPGSYVRTFFNCEFLNNPYPVFSSVVNTNTDLYVAIFNNCVINNSAIWSQNGQGNAAGQAYMLFNGSVVINALNSTVNPRAIIINGSKNTIFQNNAGITINTGSVFDYCNIFGFLGSRDNAAWQAAGQNLNGISATSQFTDPTNGQYTVNQSSPCLYRGEGGEHIGIGEGFYLQANILYFQQAAINNFQLTTGRLGFIDPLDNAFIETNPIDIGQIITLESAELAAILPVVSGEFTAGPVHYSHWYPAYSAASTYNKGAGVTDSAILYRSLIDNNLNNTPASSATEWERLTWESGVSYSAGKIVQYTDDKWYKANTATSTSWVAGEWDEVVMIREWNLQVKTGRTYDECEAADWATIPYNATPYLDLAGKGNSDDDFDTGTGAIMVFRFIAVRIDAKTIV
jgi:hypothetical protein